MLESRKNQLIRILSPIATFIAGAVCTLFIPSDWFARVLGASVLLALILAAVASVDVKNERRPPVPVMLLLEALWLPSRNGKVKSGLAWPFGLAAGWVTGMLVCAIVLPVFG